AVVHHDPTTDREAGVAGQRHRGAPACREDGEGGGEHEAVVEDEALIGQLDRASTRVDRGPQAPQVASQRSTTGRGGLTGQQVLGAFDDLGLQATAGERSGDLQAEETAADDHGAAGVGEHVAQVAAVGERTEGVHLGVQVAVGVDDPADRWQLGDQPGGQDEPPPLEAALLAQVVDEVDASLLAVDPHDPDPEPQVDAVLGEPGRVTQGEGTRRVLALQDGGEQDPVVRRVVLLAQHGDPAPEAAGDEALDQTYGRHAGADDDDP